MNAPLNVPVMEFDRVSRSFGPQDVLRELTLQVYAGETLAIIGESGCGKSVTLKLLMNLLEPTAGTVYWRGEPLRKIPRKRRDRERLKIGYLFQNAALFDSLNVYENVAFGLRQNTRLPKETIDRIVSERLSEVGLPVGIVAKKPAQLSGGMRKRVALARALALTPEIMFYDEPTTGLDPIMSDVINELILRARQVRPVTSVVITHDMRTVEKVADRIVMLYPLPRLGSHEPQAIFTGTIAEAKSSSDQRVRQFLSGEAGDRITVS